MPSGPEATSLGSGWAAGLVTLAGFALRCLELSRNQSFWWDEAYSAVVARGSLAQIARTVAAEDFHPPLHYWLLHGWARLAGEGEYALRYTSVAFGVATIALSYALGRRLFGRRGGTIAAALTAASPFHWYYSTEARMFAPAAFLALLLLWLAHRRRWAWFALAGAIALYTYYYALFAIAPAGLLALARGRRESMRFVGAAAAIALMYAPWLPILLGRTQSWDSPWTPATSPARVLLWTWPTLLTGIPDVALWMWDWRGVALATAALLLGALLAVGALRRDAGLTYAAAAGLTPLALIALVALVRPIYHPRYAIIAAPGVYLALAGALLLSGRWLRPLSAALALVLFALFGWGLWRYADGDGLTRDNYRGAVAWINATQQPNDAAIYNAPPGFEYYYRGPMPHVEVPRGPYSEEHSIAQLAEVAGTRSRLWYLTHELRPSDPEGFVQGQLDRNARLIERRDFGQVDVALYELPPDRAMAPLARHDVGPLRVGEALELVAVGVDDRPHASGGAVPVTLHWLVKAPVGADLGVWVQLQDEQGFRWGRGDRQPRDTAFRLSSGWPVGARVTTGHSIPTPIGVPPGQYRLVASAYRVADFRALEVRDAAGRPLGESADLGRVVVGPAGRVDDAALGGPAGALDEAISLAGSGISAREVGAGGAVEATLLWRAERAPGARDIVLRLLDAAGATVHEQRLATGGGRYPADRWQPGERVRDQVRLTAPPTLAPGQYRVWAGLAAPGAAPAGREIGQLSVAGVARQFAPPPIARPLDVAFADGVRLAGYAVDASGVTLFWHPTATPGRVYKVFNHLLDATGTIIAQRDAAPADWTRPTTGWLPGEYVIDRHPLPIPPAAVTLRVGLYDPITGERLAPGYVDLTL